MNKEQPKYNGIHNDEKIDKNIDENIDIDKELSEIKKSKDYNDYKDSFKHFMQEIDNTPDFFEKTPEEQKEISLKNIKKYIKK